MYGPPGIAYVYFIYGVYHCLNAVTDAPGNGSAVLIRALRPHVPEGFAASGFTAHQLGGPGRLCRAFGIDLRMNGWDLTRSRLRILRGDGRSGDVITGPRVGITSAADLPLRFRLSPPSSTSP